MPPYSETADFLSVRLQPTVWPGEPVLMMLDDLEFQWKRGRLPNLLLAMELVMLAVLNADSPAKVWTAEATTAGSTFTVLLTNIGTHRAQGHHVEYFLEKKNEVE